MCTCQEQIIICLYKHEIAGVVICVVIVRRWQSTQQQHRVYSMGNNWCCCHFKLKLTTFDIAHHIKDWAFSGALHNNCRKGEPLFCVIFNGITWQPPHQWPHLQFLPLNYIRNHHYVSSSSGLCSQYQLWWSFWFFWALIVKVPHKTFLHCFTGPCILFIWSVLWCLDLNVLGHPSTKHGINSPECCSMWWSNEAFSLTPFPLHAFDGHL